VLPVGIWSFVDSASVTASLTYYALLILTLGALITLTLISGVKLMRSMKKIYRSTKINHFKAFLRKLTKLIFGVNVSLIGAIIFLVILGIVGSDYNPWFHTGIHSCLRILEFLFVMFILVFLSKKKPDSSDSTNRSSDNPKNQASLNEVFDKDDIFDQKSVSEEEIDLEMNSGQYSEINAKIDTKPAEQSNGSGTATGANEDSDRIQSKEGEGEDASEEEEDDESKSTDS